MNSKSITTRPGVLRVAAVQMKFAPSVAGNLVKIESALASLRRQRPDAVLFPECATTGYGFEFKKLARPELTAAVDCLKSLALRFKVNLLVGSPMFHRGRLQNCLLVIDRRGQLVHRYAKCQLTPADRKAFAPGNDIALFKLDGVCCTAIICHERRYPELVRLAVMAGARILFHPNAGMDSLSVSRKKRAGRDGIAVRAFENQIYYVFANSVGRQAGGNWSAGDSKIVGTDGQVLRLADNRSEQTLVANLDLSKATGKYALESMEQPKFLSPIWRKMVREIIRRSQI